jgi:hypothetical protein
LPTDAIGVWLCTLIQICAVGTSSIQLVTVIAFTAECPGNIDAGAEDANEGDGALINILAVISVLCWQETHVTVTLIRSWGVQALTVGAQVWIPHALINIIAFKTIAREAFITDAFIGSLSVHADSILTITLVGLCSTLINIDAGIKVGEESSIALATEGATGVDTLRVHGTVVDAHGALIDINTAEE